jgi:hypothetical protein
MTRKLSDISLEIHQLNLKVNKLTKFKVSQHNSVKFTVKENFNGFERLLTYYRHPDVLIDALKNT